MRTQLGELSDLSFDLIVVGGGVTGAGILREAVRAGLRALLVEQRDYAWGASSRSSKLVHGGLRYLKEGKVMLTRHSVVERERLLDQSQDLVTPLPFLVPNYKGRSPGRLTFGAGLAIYDLIAGKWDHQHYKPEVLQALSPHLETTDLTGGLGYKDAQTDDARMVLRLIFEARAHGGHACNYARAKKVERNAQGDVSGLTVEDQVSGLTHQLQTPLVINATGAWVNRLRDNPQVKIRPLRGSHLIFPAWRFPAPQAMTLIHPTDGRPVFVLPWEGTTVFGTTDVDHRADLDEEAAIAAEEVTYLMDCAKSCFPGLDLTTDDILSTWAGVRPIISKGDDVDPSKESRDHEIWDDAGLVSITGGKLTTFRMMAFDLLQKAAAYLPKSVNFDKKTPVYDAVEPLPPHAEIDVARLVGRYGAAARSIIEDARQDELQRIPGSLNIWAELRWAARAEDVIHLEDLMLRRLRLGLVLPQGGMPHLSRIRNICQSELGWSDKRWEEEVSAYAQLWRKAYSLPDAVSTEQTP